MSKSPILTYNKASPSLSFWQVVSFCSISVHLPQPLCASCLLSICRVFASSCSFTRTEECKFQYDPQKEFVFICLQVSAEEWQGVTAANNVCGDYLRVCHQNSIIAPALFDSKTSTAGITNNASAAPPRTFCLKSEI